MSADAKTGKYVYAPEEGESWVLYRKPDFPTKEEEAAFVSHLSNKKAPPGFSNHSRGIAIDFSTVTGKSDIGFDRKAWRASWLYKWLTDNAPGDNWKQLKSEEWHWDYTGSIEESPPKT